MNRPWYINAPQVPDGSPPSPNLSLRSPRNLFELAPQTFGKMLHFLFLNNHLHLKRLQDLRRNIFFLLLNWAIKNFGCSPIILFASSFAHHLSKKKILLLTQCYSFLFLTIALLRPFPTSICHQPQHELPEKSLSLFFYETWLSLKKSAVRNQTKPNQWQEWEW